MHGQIFQTLVELLIHKNAHVNRELFRNVEQIGIMALFQVADETVEVLENGLPHTFVDGRHAFVFVVKHFYCFMRFFVDVTLIVNDVEQLVVFA